MEAELAGTVNTKALFYCPTHGMFEPGRFEPEWTDEEGCPARFWSGNACAQRMEPLDLSPALRTQADVDLRSKIKQEVERLQDEYDRAYDRFAQTGASSTAARADATAQHALAVIRRLEAILSDQKGEQGGS